MGGAPSSTRNQWEREVVRGRGLGEGAGNIVRQNTAEEIRRQQEEQEKKKVHEIVRRHSMLKAQLIDRAIQQQQAEEEAEKNAAAPAPEVEEDKKGEDHGVSQHAQLLAAIVDKDQTDDATSATQGEEVRDFGELRCRIQLDSAGNTSFSDDDQLREAFLLEKCFSSVPLSHKLQEGQFECRVLDAHVSEAAVGEESSDTGDGATSNQNNSFAFRLVIRFFSTDEGISSHLLNDMYAFLGFARKEEEEGGGGGEWEDAPSPTITAPICAKFASVCEESDPPCVVRVGKVSKASLELVTGEAAHVAMLP